MKKIALSLVICATLSGCASTPMYNSLRDRLIQISAEKLGVPTSEIAEIRSIMENKSIGHTLWMPVMPDGRAYQCVTQGPLIAANTTCASGGAGN
jgi:hypothetical protein